MELGSGAKRDNYPGAAHPESTFGMMLHAAIVNSVSVWFNNLKHL
jgi:hypothetical protein